MGVLHVPGQVRGDEQKTSVLDPRSSALPGCAMLGRGRPLKCTLGLTGVPALKAGPPDNSGLSLLRTPDLDSESALERMGAQRCSTKWNLML